VAGHKLAGPQRLSGRHDPIPAFDVRLDEADVEAVAETLRSGWLTMGPRIEAFEAEFARHLGVQHAVATSSATAALHLAYLAAGVGPGDEVIEPGITFVAAAAAARYCGARPVLAEVLGQHDSASIRRTPPPGSAPAPRPCARCTTPATPRRSRR
jgi:dTDP-4-amino-4,6-dideoxygalactose transaminase